jgi:multiple sugar transport system substrate-binding protein
MKYFRPISLALNLLVISSLILTACQTTTPAPAQATTTPAISPTPRPSHTAQPQASETPQPSPTPPPHLNIALESLRGVQVNFWHPWRSDLAVRAEEAAQAFNRENNWGVTVRVRALTSAPALYEAMNVAVNGSQTDQLPQVLAAAPEELAAWMSAGKLAGLDDYIAHAEWGMKPEEVAAFNPIFWQQDQWKGPDGTLQAGVPAVRSARVLFYNETWANELGFNRSPATTEDFKAQACAAAQANNASPDRGRHFTGGWLIDTEALTLLSWFDAFDAQVLPLAEGAPYTFNTIEAGNATSYLRKLFDQGCAWEGRNPSPHEYFTNRMALFYSGTLQDIPIQAATQQRLNSGDRWVVLPYPSDVGSGSTYSYGYSYGILTGDPQKQLASWLFVHWMSAPRNQALLAEVWPSFPVTTTAESVLADYKNNFPWSMILPLQASLRPAPSQPSWRKVRVILEDGALMQLFRLPVEQMVFFLPELDEISREVLLQELIDR